MKTVFDQSTRMDLILRINSLTENSIAQWGKMNSWQMLHHCCLAEEMLLGKKKYKRFILGKLFGTRALKSMLKDETPFMKNARTSSNFIVTGSGDVEEEKKKLIALINEYEKIPVVEIEHWFFGKMSREEIGRFSYKHNDHHLRQFNV